MMPKISRTNPEESLLDQENKDMIEFLIRTGADLPKDVKGNLSVLSQKPKPLFKTEGRDMGLGVLIVIVGGVPFGAFGLDFFPLYITILIVLLVIFLFTGKVYVCKGLFFGAVFLIGLVLLWFLLSALAWA